MKRVLKVLAWIVGLLVLLVLAAVIIVPLVVDPNDYRDDINALVEKRTGRELTIEGDLGLSVFPWLGLEVGTAYLGNAAGFGPEPFARIERAQVRVKLLPLLRRQLEVDTVELEGLRLNLARRADGTTNWADLAQAEPADEPRESTPGRALGALAVGGLRVNDAHILWVDEQVGQRAEISNFDLSSGAIDLQSPFPLAFETDFASTEPQARGHLTFRGDVGLNLDAERYRVDDMRLTVNAQSALLPGGAAQLQLTGNVGADLREQTAETRDLVLDAFGTRVEMGVDARNILDLPAVQAALLATVRDGEALVTALGTALPEGMQAQALQGAKLEAQLNADLQTQQLELPRLNLDALGVVATATATGEQILDAPVLNGEMTVAEFAPRVLLQRLGVELPEMADPATLAKADFRTRFTATSSSAALEQLALRLDESTLQGSLAARRFEPADLQFELALDAIDLDRYLPPPSEDADAEAATPTPTPASAAAAGALQLPLEQLRALTVDGRVRVAQLKAANLRSTDILVTLKGANGQFRLTPLQARLYDGSYAGDVRLDVRGETPAIAMDEKLSGVQLGPLLNDFMGDDRVTGTANLAAQLTARGLEPAAIRQSLSGQASFAVQDGAVKGVNIGHLIREAYARYKQQPLPAEEMRETDFANLTGTINLKNGLATNKDLLATSPVLKVTGEGSANLVTEQIDYRVNATVVSTLGEQDELRELRNTTIPIRISGTFSDPKFGVELGALLEQRAREALDKEKQKAEESVRERLDEEKKRLEEQLQDRFRNLFN